MQKALPLLADGASVILNSSNVANRGSDGIGVYAAIKAAVRSLARTWASELRECKIRVNVVGPGATDTPGIDTLANLLFSGPTAVDQFRDLQSNVVPLARLADADEVAKAVVFLARIPPLGLPRVRAQKGLGAVEEHRARHSMRNEHQQGIG